MRLKGNVFDYLKERGLVADTTSSDLRSLLRKKTTLYMGFDPTASSFHVGHLFALRVLKIFSDYGHNVIMLVGGATGMVGDPTGKNQSRVQLTQRTVRRNSKSLAKQLRNAGLLDTVSLPRFRIFGGATIVNNASWLGKARFLKDFMTKIAPYISVNKLLKMSTFATRLKNQEHLSLAEIIYPAMQGWDFWHLRKKMRCTLQIGGADQWANILTGTQLVKSTRGKTVYGLTFPLLVKPDGTKMGKTANGAVWLDPELTSPHAMFNYMQKIEDGMVKQLLYQLTDIPASEIPAIVVNPRNAQLRLAFEVVRLVHGDDVANELMAPHNSGLKKGQGIQTYPELRVELPNMLGNILVGHGFVSSGSQYRRLVQQGAISVGDKKISDPRYELTSTAVIKYGKNKYIKIINQ